MELPVYACTLDPEDAPRRARQGQELRARLLARHRDGTAARLDFAPGSRALVDEFVRDESACCSFFDFAVEETEEAVSLQVAAPAGAVGMLDALVDTLAPPADAARSPLA